MPGESGSEHLDDQIDQLIIDNVSEFWIQLVKDNILKNSTFLKNCQKRKRHVDNDPFDMQLQ